MARSLSVDLRRRVVGAIEGGSSCRAAAQRFGVSASSAIRWWARGNGGGRYQAQTPGGRPPFATDRSPCRTNPFGRGRQERHYTFRTAGAAEGAQRRRRHRHTLAVLQTPQDHAQKTAQAAEQRRGAVNAGHARRGLRDNSTSIRHTSVSSTRPPRTPRWRAFTVVRPGASDAAPPCPMATGKPPPSPRAYVMTGSLRPWSSTAR
jgi:hypothetical protein